MVDDFAPYCCYSTPLPARSLPACPHPRTTPFTLIFFIIRFSYTWVCLFLTTRYISFIYATFFDFILLVYCSRV